jgi:hypothetical protein
MNKGSLSLFVNGRLLFSPKIEGLSLEDVE